MTPGSAGLYQLNLLLPPDTPTGNVSVVIQVGNQQSPAGAFITVAAN